VGAGVAGDEAISFDIGLADRVVLAGLIAGKLFWSSFSGHRLR